MSMNSQTTFLQQDAPTTSLADSAAMAILNGTKTIYTSNNTFSYEKRYLSELYKTDENGTKVLLINKDSTILSSEEMDDMVKNAIYFFLALFFLYFLITALWQYCIDTDKVVKYIKYCDCKSDHTTMQMFELVLQDFMVPIKAEWVPSEYDFTVFKIVDMYLGELKDPNERPVKLTQLFQDLKNIQTPFWMRDMEEGLIESVQVQRGTTVKTQKTQRANSNSRPTSSQNIGGPSVGLSRESEMGFLPPVDEARGRRIYSKINTNEKSSLREGGSAENDDDLEIHDSQQFEGGSSQVKSNKNAQDNKDGAQGGDTSKVLVSKLFYHERPQYIAGKLLCLLIERGMKKINSSYYRKSFFCFGAPKLPDETEIFNFLRDKKNFRKAFNNWTDEELQQLCRDYLGLTVRERSICLEADARIYANLILLRFMIGYIAFWIWFRFLNTGFNQITQQLAIFLAIMAVFFSFLDMQLVKKIDTPETYIWANLFGKTFKACFTATVFICNNTPNDFTISLVFLITSFIGLWYYQNNNVNRPGNEKNSDLSICTTNKHKIVALEHKIKILVATEFQGNGYRWLAFLTLTLFVFMMFLSTWQNTFCVGILEVDWPDHFMPSTLGYSAVIMILYNAMAWPDMKAKLESTKLQDKTNELDRAKMLVQELENLCKFVSLLMNMISDLANKKDLDYMAALKKKLPMGGSTMEIWCIAKSLGRELTQDEKALLSKNKQAFLVQSFKIRITEKELGEGDPTDYQGIDEKQNPVLQKVFIDRDLQTIAFNWKKLGQGEEQRFSFMKDMKDATKFNQTVKASEKQEFYVVFNKAVQKEQPAAAAAAAAADKPPKDDDEEEERLDDEEEDKVE